MRICIVYTSNSGSTFLAAETIANVLRSKHVVDVVKAETVVPATLSGYDVVLLGSPTWEYGGKEGNPPKAMAECLLRLRKERYPGMSFAVFGCGDSAYTDFCGAVDHLERFVLEAGGVLKVPSLRVDSYYYNEKNNRALVAHWAEGLL